MSCAKPSLLAFVLPEGQVQQDLGKYPQSHVLYNTKEASIQNGSVQTLPAVCKPAWEARITKTQVSCSTVVETADNILVTVFLFEKNDNEPKLLHL